MSHLQEQNSHRLFALKIVARELAPEAATILQERKCNFTSFGATKLNIQR